MESLYLVVHITDVFLQVSQSVKSLLTLGTGLGLLSRLSMPSPDVSHPTCFRTELRPTLFTTVLRVRVLSFKVVHHIRFAFEGLPTVGANKTWF